MSHIDKTVMKAKNDPEELENLIRSNDKFILSSASRAIGRYVTKSDDQWSVALLAFQEAVNTYSVEKGSFYSFANMVIRRRLIDYVKAESRHYNEMVVNPSVFESEPDEEEEQAAIKREVVAHLATRQDDSARLEIEALGMLLFEYGFSFYDLISASPKAAKTKAACANAVCLLVQNKQLYNRMRTAKVLPIKYLENNLNLPRKILERHRKYIIAGVEILKGDYPILAGYLGNIREKLT